MFRMRNLFPIIIIAASFATEVLGQSAPHYPADDPRCSPSDQSGLTFAEQALFRGDVKEYALLEAQAENGISDSCRTALDEHWPARSKCSAEEKDIAIAHYRMIFGNPPAGDQKAFQVLEDLEASVSQACWTGLNYPQDPNLRQVCSSTELEAIAFETSSAVRAGHHALLAHDYSDLNRMMRQRDESLTPKCVSALHRDDYLLPHPEDRWTNPFVAGNLRREDGGVYRIAGFGACNAGGCQTLHFETPPAYLRPPGNLGIDEFPPPPSPDSYKAPTFPWPPPTPSGRLDLTATVGTRVHPSTMGDVNALLTGGLDRTGYFERSYFSVPNGFALVTKMERITPTGKSMDPPARWSTGTALPVKGLTLSDYFRSLFTAVPGYYRIVVFVVTSAPFSAAGKKVAEDEASAWLEQGTNVLPPALARLAYTPETACTALVYEFERPADTSDNVEMARLVSSHLDARTHLVHSGLWSAIAGD